MAVEEKRIFELAKEHKVSSHALLKILKESGFEPKSHMSLATIDMIRAINDRYAQEKEKAKKEMEHRAQVTQSIAKKQIQIQKTKEEAVKAAPDPIKQKALLKVIDKKPKKKDKRKKRDKIPVNQEEVAKTFKTTLAKLTSGKVKRKYKKGGGDGDDADSGPSNVIEVNEFMTVAELARTMDRKAAELIAKLFELGMMATINQRLDLDAIETIAAEFDFETKLVSEVGEEVKEEENLENAVYRAPIVTVMGHVDHGKTSLLDYIRKSNVVDKEAGSITQHIGAYTVTFQEKIITFIDTPGHEAFTAMRARGSQITDIVVLVVAADDGVQPQTVEAIDHARAADVPIIVAINKIDKPTANIDNVRSKLSEHNLVSEEWGGKTIMVEVSAKTGDGVEKLLELVLLQAEMLDLKADPNIRAQGVVVDSRLERGKGAVATILIQRGTCRIGEPIISGINYGRIRTIVSDKDVALKEVGPSMPVQITGLNGTPQAGDSFYAVQTDQEAKELALKRSQVKREQESRRTHGRLTLDRVFDRIREGAIKELKLIIKADVDGSVEVLSDTLGKLETDEVRTNIIHEGVGPIIESDVLLAAASDAIIIGFNVVPDARARDLAKKESIEIKHYDIIYEAEREVKEALSGMLSPEISEEFVGAAEVRELFKVPKLGLIAGCFVRDGRITRKDKVKLVRDGQIIYDGIVGSLRRFKDDAKEVKEGFECGIGIEGYNDIKVGDSIEAYKIVETARTLQ